MLAANRKPPCGRDTAPGRTEVREQEYEANNKNLGKLIIKNLILMTGIKKPNQCCSWQHGFPNAQALDEGI
jgi:5'-3' exonuclease